MSDTTSKYFDDAGNRQGLAKKTISGTIVNVSSQFCLLVVNLASIAVLGRYLDEIEFGLVGMAITWTALASLLGNFGISSAILQRPNINHDEVHWLWVVSMAVGALMCVLSILAAPLLSLFYEESALKHVLLVQSIGFIFTGASNVHSALLQRSMEFGRLAITNVAGQILGLITGIVLAICGFSYWSIVVGALIGEGIRTILLWFVCSWRPKACPIPQRFGELVFFGWYVMVTGIMNYISTNIDNILIGKFFGTGDLGFYTRAYSVQRIPVTKILPALRKVGDASLSRLAATPKKFTEAAQTFLHFYLVVGTPIVIILGLGALPAIRILMGPGWEKSALIFQAMAPLTWVQLTSSVGTMCFFASGHVKEMARWNFINCILSVLSIIVGLPWGPLGVALSYSISGIVIRTPYLFYRMKCIDGFEPFSLMKIQLVYGIVGVICAAITFLLHTQTQSVFDVVNLIFISVVVILTYIPACLFVPSIRQAIQKLFSRIDVKKFRFA